MTLRTCSLHFALPLLFAACVPGSLKLGEDSETDPEPGTDSVSSGESGTDEPSTGEPTTGETTGEPAPEGVLEWTRKFDDVTGVDMTIAGDGSIVVVGLSGYTYNGGDGGEYANRWVGKFDAAGAPLWEVETPIEELASGIPLAVAVRDDGVVHVLDIDYNVLGGGGNGIRRFTADGELLGTTTLLVRPAAIAATASGIVVGGTKADDDTAVAWVAGLDAEGLSIWEQTFGDPDMAWSAVTAIAGDGDEVVLGGSLGVAPDSSQSQAWLGRASVADGTMIWERTIDTGSVLSNTVYDLGIAGDGSILARVRAEGDFVIAVDPAGADLWTHTLTDVRGASVAVAQDGSFALAGAFYLPDDHPDACFAGDGTCPVAMQAVRHDADRSVRWFAQRDECTSGNVAAVTPNDGILVLAGCSKDGLGDAIMGLMLFAP